MKTDIKKMSQFLILSMSASLVLMGCGNSSSNQKTVEETEDLNISTEVENIETNTSSVDANETNTTDDGVNVILTLQDVDWVAYQVGSGDWQEIDSETVEKNQTTMKIDNGNITLPLGKDSKFGIAYVCAESKQVNVWHDNFTETDKLTFSCDPETTFYKVQGTVQGLNGNQALVSVGGASSYSVGGTYSTNYVTKGTHDIGAVELDASHTTSLRFGIKRDVLVEDNKTGEDITLTYSMTPYSLAITGATSHWVSLLTKNNSYIHLGSYNATTEWYKPSDEALIEGDRYYISGYWSSNDREQSVSISEVIPVANAGDYTYDLSSVPLLNVTTNSALPLQFNNLNYNDGNADSYRMNFLQIDGYQWDIFICNDWLGDETSYTQPDFSSLANWNSDWNSFKNGDAVSWSASASVFKEATNMQKTRRGTSSIYYGLWIYASSYKSFVL